MLESLLWYQKKQVSVLVVLFLCFSLVWLRISQFSFSVSFWIQSGLSMVMTLSALLSPPMKVNTESLIHHLFGLCFSVYWNLNCCFETLTRLETADWGTGWGSLRCGELIYHPAAAKRDRTTQGKEGRGASLLFLDNQLFHQLRHVWYWSLKLWVLSSFHCCKGIFLVINAGKQSWSLSCCCFFLVFSNHEGLSTRLLSVIVRSFTLCKSLLFHHFLFIS